MEAINTNTKPKQTNKEIKSAKKSRGEGNDAKRVAQRLQSFNPQDCLPFKKISSRFPLGISHAELKRIAEILSENLSLHLDRDAKRDNRVLLKWFDENWPILENEIDRIHAYDDNLNLIEPN